MAGGQSIVTRLVPPCFESKHLGFASFIFHNFPTFDQHLGSSRSLFSDDIQCHFSVIFGSQKVHNNCKSYLRL